MLCKLYYPVKSLTDYEVSSLEKVLRLKNQNKGWRGASG